MFSYLKFVRSNLGDSRGRLTDSIPNHKHVLVELIYFRASRPDDFVFTLVPAVTLLAGIHQCGITPYTSSTRTKSNVDARSICS